MVRHENVIAPGLQVLQPANLDLHSGQANSGDCQAVRNTIERYDVAGKKCVEQQERSRDQEREPPKGQHENRADHCPPPVSSSPCIQATRCASCSGDREGTSWRMYICSWRDVSLSFTERLPRRVARLNFTVAPARIRESWSSRDAVAGLPSTSTTWSPIATPVR